MFCFIAILQFTVQLQQQHLFNGPLFGTIQVSQHLKGKTNLDLVEQEIVSGIGISWAICIANLHLAPDK